MKQREKSAAWLFMAVIVLQAIACHTSRISKACQRKVEGKTIVITGASSGFGKGVAIQLGQYHAHVVLAARRTALLEAVAAEVRAAGGMALVVTTDVSKPEDVERLAEAAVKAFGHIDVWINNAGVGAIGRFWDIPLAEQSKVIDITLKGTIYGSYAAMRRFKAQGYGTLVNVGSIDSEVPLAYQGSYSASKAGVRSLGEVLAQELRLDGEKKIKVSTVMPWATDTPWWEHAANYSGGTPRMAAMDDPREVVNAIVRATVHPKRQMTVGWKARGSYFFHHLFPHPTEAMSANIAHKYQYTTAPPAPPTSGTLFVPMQSGQGVGGGVRERMKKEGKERRKKKQSSNP
jgi:short-subunit dehydrogenase